MSLMISESNLLFDYAKIRCGIEFINKGKSIERCEMLKNFMKKHCSEVDIIYHKEGEESQLRKHFLQFSERVDTRSESASALSWEPQLKFLVSVNEEERYEKISSSYKTYLNSLKDPELERLIFIVYKPIDPKEKENNIEIIELEINDEENCFISQFKPIIEQMVVDFLRQISTKQSLNVDNMKATSTSEIKTRCEEYIQAAEYKLAYQTYAALIDINKNNPMEQFKFRECQAISVFLEDLTKVYSQTTKMHTIRNLRFNSDIESIFENASSYYKKLKQSEQFIEINLKLATYYTLFEAKTRQFLDVMKRIYDELDPMPSHYRLKCLLLCRNLFEKLKMKRKSSFYLYLALAVCFESPDLMQMIPFIFNEMSKRFLVYDIFKDKIENPEEFTEVHKRVLKSNWKKIAFSSAVVSDERSSAKETTRKRIDKDMKLYVINRLESVRKYLLMPVWEPIQYNIFLNMVNFYKGVQDLKSKISYGLSYLQALTSFISSNEQKTLLISHQNDSVLLQEKIFLNLSKLPILVKIIPLASDIKFDSSRNVNYASFSSASSLSSSQVFLYNPWEKEDGVNYYWTSGSFQKVYIQFSNPLSFEIRLTKIVLLFEGAKPFSFPTSTIIQPNAVHEVVCKIRPTERGITSIMGIKYEICNTSAVQFADWNGNGLYYGYENYSTDAMAISNNKKEKINLHNIQIFPEIPLLEIKILDNSSKIINGSLDLYEYQFYNFSFLLENIGNYHVDELTAYVYAYKKDDYKISLDEIKIKPAVNNEEHLISIKKTFKFNYKYLHKKAHKKIEFKIYYISYHKNEKSCDDILIKPYLYYQKPLHTLKLLNLSTLKVIPMLSNNTIHEIAMSDPRIPREYSKFFCSEKYYVSFIIGNSHEDTLNFQIYSRDALIKQELCECKNSKEISFVVDSEMKLSEFTMQWEFSNLSNCMGRIDLSQIFMEFAFKFKNIIKFEILSSEEEDPCGVKFFSVQYKLRNNSDIHFKNLKLYIYLYQIYEDNLIFNNHLSDDIFYEGSLYYQIKELKEYNMQCYTLKIYPIENEHISTTCLVVDPSNEIVYMSPISKMFYLKE